jgi:CheY-like chemotaxis protein
MAAKARKTAAKKLSILLVDDDPGDCRLVEESLRDSKRASKVTIVNSGDDALAYLRKARGKTGKPDIVLLDLNMPGKDGFATLKEIRGDKGLTELPVVILTTSTNQDDVDQSYRLHANCFVSKPTSFGDFGDAVREIEEFWADTARLPA